MALDAQRNWNVEMSQPLRAKHNVKFTTPEPETAEPAQYDWLRPGKEVHLPYEIVIQILSYLPRREQDQKTLWACCLISRVWYAACVALLYERPYIAGGNFQAFVTTLCPSKNAHIRKSPLAHLVKRLDMGSLVHDGSKSLTARMLGRLKGNLEEFVAPQASFSINSFAALSKCNSLKYLDLSLMSASVTTDSLFHTLAGLENLETLFFPRTRSPDKDLEKSGKSYSWPPRLRALHLAGGIDDSFLNLYVCNTPSTLERLSIQHCPQVHTGALQHALETIGPRLKHLTVRHPMNKLMMGSLDETLMACPNLTALRISADYITDLLFQFEHILPPHPLQILDLDCSDTADSAVSISPDGIWVAIESGFLADLRSIRVSSRLAWEATATLRRSVVDLVDLLAEQDKSKPLGVKPGVWSFI